MVVGGWGKGASVSLSNGTGRYFALDIGINLDNGTTQWEVVQFNEDSSDWQYASKRFIASGPYHSITYYLLYYNEANTAYFDGLQLYKEEFGQSYVYDTNGNVTSAVDLAKQESKFEYSNNDVTKITDPKGSQFKYTYDPNHNVKTATSAENVLYSFDYDGNGNPKTSKVGDSTLFNQTTATYTSDGNYLKTLTDSDGNTVTYNYNDLTKGNLDSVTDAKGQTTSYVYDPKNDQLNSVSTTAEGQTVSNSYTYVNDQIKTIKQNNTKSPTPSIMMPWAITPPLKWGPSLWSPIAMKCIKTGIRAHCSNLRMGTGSKSGSIMTFLIELKLRSIMTRLSSRTNMMEAET